MSGPHIQSRRPPTRDRGAILPMVLVVSVVLSVVVVAVTTYTATTLRYGHVVEARAGRLAAANGAMDDALEQLSIRSSVCSTSAGGGDGVDTEFPEQINGATAVVNCRIATGEVPSGDFFAIGITGEGAPGDGSKTFRFTLGGKPEIGGPVFVHDVSRVQFDQPTTISEGDLWYTDHTCAGDAMYQKSGLTVPNLSFDPEVRGTYCIAKTWDELAGPTPTPPVDLDGLPPRAPDSYTSEGSCRVFEPGRYGSAPDFGKRNYFRSGIYYFADVGEIALKGDVATMGHRDAEGYPVIDNSACDGVRQADSSDGATLYTSGSTRFSSQSNSGFEVSGRKLPGSERRIGLQVMGPGPGYHTPLLSSDPGAKKEIAIWGQLWAPYSSVVFGTVPAQKAAALRGGAWVARLEGGVSAAAIGFVIEVPLDAAPTKLVLESTATDDRGSNTVRVIADYRPSTGEVAVNSRRVVG